MVTTPRLLLLLAACACALLAVPGAATAAGAKAKRAPCADAGLAPTQANLGAVRAAVLCLHNRERGARGLPALKENAKLRNAAAAHSQAMVAQGFFAHDSPGGAGMVDRILGAGYAGDVAWSLGENIAWATGRLATAAEIQQAWMRSPGHKANILRRQFREIGIGIAIGAPVNTDGQNGATYTADFGVRR